MRYRGPRLERSAEVQEARHENVQNRSGRVSPTDTQFGAAPSQIEVVMLQNFADELRCRVPLGK
jgi:hypothetical protein